MGALITAFATWVSGLNVAQFLAFKIILFALFTVILPIILYNFALEWMLQLLGFALSYVSGSLPGDTMPNFTGLAGWFMVNLNMPEIVTTIVSALAVRLLITSVLKT